MENGERAIFKMGNLQKWESLKWGIFKRGIVIKMGNFQKRESLKAESLKWRIFNSGNL